MIAVVFAAIVVVLPVDGQPDQTGFVEALRIQLAGSGEVVAGPTLVEGSLPERVAAAGGAASAAGAQLAVWVERAPAAGGGEDVVLYVVGEADGRAVVQVFRLAAGAPADTDRALALKVGAVLDELLAPAGQAVLARPPPESPKPKPEPPDEKPPIPASRPTPTHLVVGVSAQLGTSPGDDGWDARTGLVGGRRFDAGDVQLELDLALTYGTGDTWTRSAGTIETDEWDAAVGARVLGVGGPASDLGVHVAVGARALRALGTSPAGRKGTELAFEPVAQAALEKRWRGRGFELVLAIGAEVTPVQQNLTINVLPVAEIGHIRGFVGLSLMRRIY